MMGGVMKLVHAAEGLGLDIEMHGPGPAQRRGATVEGTATASITEHREGIGTLSACSRWLS